MEKRDIENYINKLKYLDNIINGTENDAPNINDGFIDELNNVLTSLSKDIEKDMKKSVEAPIKLPVKFKKLRPDAIIPTYAKDGDAGLDITATHIISNTSTQVEYGTGLSFEVPKGYVMLIFPRSSIRNYGLELSNSVGVLDSGYRGELKFTFNKTRDSHIYSEGNKIGQIIIIPYPEIELVESNELSKTERNDGGFGSSGK